MTTFATLVDVLGSSWTQHVHKLCTLDQNAHLPAFYGSQAQPPLLGSMDSDWCCRAPHSSPLTDEFITMLWMFFGRRPLPFGGSPLEAYPWTSGNRTTAGSLSASNSSPCCGDASEPLYIHGKSTFQHRRRREGALKTEVQADFGFQPLVGKWLRMKQMELSKFWF